MSRSARKIWMSPQPMGGGSRSSPTACTWRKAQVFVRAPEQLPTPAGSIVDNFAARCVTQVVGLSSKRSTRIFCGCGLPFAGCFQCVFAKNDFFSLIVMFVRHRSLNFSMLCLPWWPVSQLVTRPSFTLIFASLMLSSGGIVGPPADIQWDMPWHLSLHQWNAKAMRHWERLRRPTWGQVC